MVVLDNQQGTPCRFRPAGDGLDLVTLRALLMNLLEAICTLFQELR
jgi:hypothetical protein